MSALLDSYTKNKSPEVKKRIEERVFELSSSMSELSAILLALAELREEQSKADGGRVNFDMGGIFSINPDEAVKFNLDGEIINLNPKFFEMFMGPFMNDPKMLKRRIDDLKQEIRRNQKVVKAADGGIADLLKV